MSLNMSSAVFSVAWSLNGCTIASGSYDQTIRVWDSISGECAKILTGDKPVWCVAFSYSGTFIAAGEGDLSRGGVRLHRYCPASITRKSASVQQNCVSPRLAVE